MTHYQECHNSNFGEVAASPHWFPWIARRLLLPWVGFLLAPFSFAVPAPESPSVS